VIGFVAITIMPLIHCDGLLARIAAICVDEKSRSAGIGKELIRFIEKKCSEKNCVLLEVTTKLIREKAHQFYLKNGFVETHKRFNKIPATMLSKVV
jgi:GNAT superfamily N-acetyltransferase